MPRRITLVLTPRKLEDPAPILERVADDVNHPNQTAAETSPPPSPGANFVVDSNCEQLETEANEKASAALDERDRCLRTPDLAPVAVAPTAPLLKKVLAELRRRGITVTAELRSDVLVELSQLEG